MNHDPTSEVYGSRLLYGAIVAGAAMLLIATLSGYAPDQTPVQHAANAPGIETVVVTPTQSA